MQNVFDIFITGKRPAYICNIAGDYISYHGPGIFSNSMLQIPPVMFEPSLPFHRFSIITKVHGHGLESGQYPSGHVNAIVYDEKGQEILKWKRLPCMKLANQISLFYGIRANWTLFSRGTMPRKLLLSVPHNARIYESRVVYAELDTDDLEWDDNLYFIHERLTISFAGKASKLVFNFEPFTVTMQSYFFTFGVGICESSAIPFGWL
jgi:hypothetical protein